MNRFFLYTVTLLCGLLFILPIGVCAQADCYKRNTDAADAFFAEGQYYKAMKKYQAAAACVPCSDPAWVKGKISDCADQLNLMVGRLERAIREAERREKQANALAAISRKQADSLDNMNQEMGLLTLRMKALAHSLALKDINMTASLRLAALAADLDSVGDPLVLGNLLTFTKRERAIYSKSFHVGEPFLDAGFLGENASIYLIKAGGWCHWIYKNGDTLHRELDEGQIFFGPHGNRVALLSYDGQLAIFDSVGNRMNSEARNLPFVDFLIFSPDGKRMVLSAQNPNDGQSELLLCNQDGVYLAKLRGYSLLAFSSAGDRILTQKDGQVFLCDADGRPIEIDGKTVLFPELYPDTSLVITRDYGSTVILDAFGAPRDLFKGEELLAYFIPNRINSPLEDQINYSTADGKNGRRLKYEGRAVALSYQDGWARLRKLDGRVVAKLDTNVREARFSPIGNCFVTIGYRRTVLWSPEGKIIRELDDQFDVQFSPDGTRLISYPRGVNQPVSLWDTEGRKIFAFEKDGGWEEWTRFSENGQILIKASSGGVIRVYSLTNGYNDLIDLNNFWSKKTISTSDSWQISTSDTSIAIIDPHGRPTKTLKGDFPHGTFSPDGHWVLLMSTNDPVRFLDKRGNLICEFRANDAHFSIDSKWIRLDKGLDHLLIPTPDWVREWLSDPECPVAKLDFPDLERYNIHFTQWELNQARKLGHFLPEISSVKSLDVGK